MTGYLVPLIIKYVCMYALIALLWQQLKNPGND